MIVVLFGPAGFAADTTSIALRVGHLLEPESGEMQDDVLIMVSRVVRLAELRIDPGQLGEYKAALREQIEASIRLEPGVLTLYAVSVKGDPGQIRIFEMYADTTAYQAHLQTPHFKKYKASTEGMVKSLVLVETDPIVLGAKPK